MQGRYLKRLLSATGADFVVQLATTFSSLVRGVGVFAGQPFHCAVTYFPGDNLSKAEGKALEEVPHCSGCPAGKVIHCASANECFLPTTFC